MPEIGTRCSCGGVYSRATRFEATRTIDVVICWRCGVEEPPLHQRPSAAYNVSPKRCGGCDRMLPRSDFDDDNRRPYAVQPWCRACHDESRRTAKEVAPANRGPIHCRNCGSLWDGGLCCRPTVERAVAS